VTKFFIPIYGSSFGRHDVGKLQMQILCSTYSKIAQLALALS